MSLAISILGALVAITVSVIGAWLANRNNIILQTRKLKEEHYVSYMEAVHNHAANNNTETLGRYVFVRDKLFLIASENVIKKMLLYEENGIGQEEGIHDRYLTDLIKEIRVDLKLKDRDFPRVYLKKS